MSHRKGNSIQFNTVFRIGKWLGGVAIVGGLAYLKYGAGLAKNTPMVPDAIEDHLDKVVETLNKKFGKRWVTLATVVLANELAKSLPQSIVALVEFVHEAESWGSGQLSSATGLQKRARAAQLARERRGSGDLPGGR